MSNHDEFPAFAGSGDPREEALWQAHQAMLRRRREPRARDLEPESRPTPLSTRAARRRPVGRRALAATLAVAGTAALGLGVWRQVQDGQAQATRAKPASDQRPPAIAEAGPKAAPGAHPTLPCFVAGQLVGRFTLNQCASRDGVAGGSLVGDPDMTSPSPPAARFAASEPRFGQRKDSPVVRFFADPRIPSSPAITPHRLAPPLRLAPPGRPFVEPPAPEAAPTPAPQDLGVRSANPAADIERRSIAPVSPRRASALAAREFYAALGQGDGGRAAAVVIPEKREAGALSAGELTRFYSSLREPLRLTRLDPINDDTVFVGYEFVTAGNRLCTGTARVKTVHRAGETLVEGIRALNGC